MADFDPLEAWPFQDEDRHFCSGVNAPGEVKGLAMSGRNVGITFDTTREPMLEELATFAGPGHTLDLFVDSGAFSEVDFTEAGRVIVSPITDAGWRERLQLYRRMAELFGRRAYLVLPDAVGDQAETLARLERYVGDVRALAQLGAQLILPVQGGALDGVDFVDAAVKVLGLGLDRLILGIPSRKAATTPEALASLCRSLWKRGAECPTFHLLGMGAKAKQWEAMHDSIRDWFAEAIIYSDSVDHRRELGQTNGPGGTPRRLTEAQDRLRATGLDSYETKSRALLELGLEDMRRAAQAARRRGWFDPELESAPGVPFLLDDGTPCLDYGPGGAFGVGGGLQGEFRLG